MRVGRWTQFGLAGVVIVGTAGAQDTQQRKPPPPEVTRIVADLGSDNLLVQSAARERLRALDAQAQADAIDPVAGLLAAKNPTTRAVAAFALGDVGSVARGSVGRLTNRLRDDDRTVRYAAATALGQIGTGAAAAVPALTRSLKDESVSARLAAAEALFCVAKDVAAIPALVTALADPSPTNRRTAARVLGRYGALAEEGVEPLRRLIADEDGFTRVQAAEALWRIARSAEAVPVLVREMKAADSLVRYAAADALWSVNRDPEVIDTLIGALRHPDSTHRLLAAISLGRLGPSARKAVAGLRKLSGDEDEYVRKAAATALAVIEKAAK